MPRILAQQMPQLATWRVVVGGGVSSHRPTITPPPTTTCHMASCVICCAKMCGTRFTHEKNVWPLFTNNPNLEPKITLVTVTSRDVASFGLPP